MSRMKGFLLMIVGLNSPLIMAQSIETPKQKKERQAKNIKEFHTGSAIYETFPYQLKW